MSTGTGIEWTDATWNPTAGCSLVSPGCTNCYAMKMAGRLEAMGQQKYVGLTTKVNGRTVWTGKMNLDESALLAPLSWKKPRKVFVNSMSDLFHEGVPDAFIDRVFAVMALTPQHTYQILTKRPERMAQYLAGEGPERWFDWAMNFAPGHISDRADICEELDRRGGFRVPSRHVWLGTSVENQKAADERIPHLLRCPAAVRFLSCEPLLGPVNLKQYLEYVYQSIPGAGLNAGELHWIIVGGESGPDARPFDVQWARDIVGQCRAAGVAVFVKQLGGAPTVGRKRCPDCNGDGREHIPCDEDDDRCEFCNGTGQLLGEFPGPLKLKDKKGGESSEWSEDLRVREFPTPQLARV